MSDLPSDTEGGTGRFGASIVIERPIGEAFASTTDLNNHHIWDSAVRSSAQTSAGPMGMDTTFQWTVQLLAKSFTFEFETTAYEPNRRFAYQSTSGPFSARSEWAYEAANGGTRFSWVAEGKPGARGLFGRLTDQLVARVRGAEVGSLRRPPDAPAAKARAQCERPASRPPPQRRRRQEPRIVSSRSGRPGETRCPSASPTSCS